MKGSKKYIVYHVIYEGDIVYIGSGVDGREKHTSSGTSHVYELNKLHFEGKDFTTKIVKRFATKEESLVCEKDHILRFTPPFNNVYLPTNRAVSGMQKFGKFKSDIEYWVNHTLHREKREKYSKMIEVLFDRFSAKDLYNGISVDGYAKTPKIRTILECRFLKKGVELWNDIFDVVELTEKDGKRFLRLKHLNEDSIFV